MRITLLIIISISLSLASDVFTDSKTGLMWQDNSAAKYEQKDWQGRWHFVANCIWKGMMTGDFQTLKNSYRYLVQSHVMEA